MADTSVLDTQLVNINQQITQLTADKAVLVALTNPNTDICKAINNINQQLARLNLRLFTVNQTKSDMISQYNAQHDANTIIMNAYGSHASTVYQKYT